MYDTYYMHWLKNITKRTIKKDSEILFNPPIIELFQLKKKLRMLIEKYYQKERNFSRN